MVILLFWSRVFGCILSGVIYPSDAIKKLVQLSSKALQKVFAYDFYTPNLCRLSMVFAVNRVDKIIAWVDRFIVDDAVSLVKLAAILVEKA